MCRIQSFYFTHVQNTDTCIKSTNLVLRMNVDVPRIVPQNISY